MKTPPNNAISLEIPTSCVNKNSILKFTWILKNNGKYEPRVQLFFKSKMCSKFFANLKFYKTNTFLLNLEKKCFTNVIKTINILLKITKDLRFNGFFDFNYFSNLNSQQNDNLKEMVNYNLKENSLVENTREAFHLPVDLIPINFTRFRYFNYKFDFKGKPFNFKKKCHSNLAFKINKDLKDTPLGLDRRSIFSFISKLKNGFDFIVDLIPKQPPLTYQKCLRLIPSFAIGFLLRLFKHRPIWTKKSLERYLPISSRRHLNQILPFISYRFKGLNPFKETWLRFKFEPRKNQKTRMYQTTGFQKKNPRFYTQKKEEKVDLMIYKKPQKNKNPKKLRTNNNSKIYILKDQICDLSEAEFNEIIRKSCLGYITSKTGWLK